MRTNVSRFYLLSQVKCDQKQQVPCGTTMRPHLTHTHTVTHKSSILFLPIRAAFADREKNHKSLVSGDGSRGGGGSRSGGGSKGGGGSGGGGDNGGGAGQSPYPLQAFCNSSILLRLETHFLRK